MHGTTAFLHVVCRHLLGPLGWQIAAAAYIEETRMYTHLYTCDTTVQGFLRLCAETSSKFVSYTFHMFFLTESDGLTLSLATLCYS